MMSGFSKQLEECIKLENLNFSSTFLPKEIISLTKKERIAKEKKILGCQSDLSTCGQKLGKHQVRKAGDYLIGAFLGSSPVSSMAHCLARKITTGEYYTIKILSVHDSEEDSQDDRQGKMLLHTEHSLLSMLSGVEGVVRQHGLFQDYAWDGETEGGKLVRRFCLVLDCVIRHDYDPSSVEFVNLQQYVISKRRLKESEALIIFYEIVSIVQQLHEMNIVHRDIKLANIVLNQRTRKITLTNFCLGQNLVTEDHRLKDQRGSPAYISPDVLSGKPYLAKPSDMWALGVVFFTMQFGQFPFYHAQHHELFKKIKNGPLVIPPTLRNEDARKTETINLIKGLLEFNPSKRLTAEECLNSIKVALSSVLKMDTSLSTDRLVPEMQEQTAPEEEEVDPMYNAFEALNFLPPKTKTRPLNFFDKGNKNFRLGLNSKYPRADTQNSSSVTTIEGDIRSFTQHDIFMLRNLFPPVPADFIKSLQTSVTTASLTVRTSSSNGIPSSRPSLQLNSLSSPRLNLAHLNSSVFEFSRPRRIALAVMQQMHNVSDSQVPSVPDVNAVHTRSIGIPQELSKDSFKSTELARKSEIKFQSASNSSNDQDAAPSTSRTGEAVDPPLPPLKRKRDLKKQFLQSKRRNTRSAVTYVLNEYKMNRGQFEDESMDSNNRVEPANSSNEAVDLSNPLQSDSRESTYLSNRTEPVNSYQSNEVVDLSNPLLTESRESRHSNNVIESANSSRTDEDANFSQSGNSSQTDECLRFGNSLRSNFRKPTDLYGNSSETDEIVDLSNPLRSETRDSTDVTDNSPQASGNLLRSRYKESVELIDRFAISCSSQAKEAAKLANSLRSESVESAPSPIVTRNSSKTNETGNHSEEGSLISRDSKYSNCIEPATSSNEVVDLSNPSTSKYTISREKSDNSQTGKVIDLRLHSEPEKLLCTSIEPVGSCQTEVVDLSNPLQLRSRESTNSGHHIEPCSSSQANEAVDLLNNPIQSEPTEPADSNGHIEPGNASQDEEVVDLSNPLQSEYTESKENL